MKFLYLPIALVLLLSLHTNAQNCRGVDEKTDKFSNKTEKVAQVALGGLLTKWSVDVHQSEGETFMKWGIAMKGEFNQRIEEGTPLLLRLENGEVLNLKTVEPSDPVTKVSNNGTTVTVFSVYYLKYDLSKKSLEKLAQSPITDLKVDIPGQEIKSPSVKGRQSNKLQDIFDCMLRG